MERPGATSNENFRNWYQIEIDPTLERSYHEKCLSFRMRFFGIFFSRLLIADFYHFGTDGAH